MQNMIKIRSIQKYYRRQTLTKAQGTHYRSTAFKPKSISFPQMHSLKNKAVLEHDFDIRFEDLWNSIEVF